MRVCGETASLLSMVAARATPVRPRARVPSRKTAARMTYTSSRTLLPGRGRCPPKKSPCSAACGGGPPVDADAPVGKQPPAVAQDEAVSVASPVVRASLHDGEEVRLRRRGPGVFERD